MGDPTRGLYDKFEVRRTDGSSDPGGKHHGCRYFVLDLTHDTHAIPALEAYARSCREEYPLLAEDLVMIAKARAAKSAVDASMRKVLTDGQALEAVTNALRPLGHESRMWVLEQAKRIVDEARPEVRR